MKDTTINQGIKPQRIQAVLFDLDGTLMETAHDLAATLEQLLKQHQKPLINFSNIEEQTSNGITPMLMEGFNLPADSPNIPELRKQFITLYARKLKTACTTPLYPYMDHLLLSLEQRNIQWGIVTNKPRALSELLLAWHQLSTRCAVLVCPEDVKATKPDPEPLLKASGLTNCHPSQCVYIGDHQRDIIAGQQAGMTTIAALYGYVEKDADPAQWQATFSAKQPADILQWLETNQWNIPTPA